MAMAMVMAMAMAMAVVVMAMAVAMVMAMASQQYLVMFLVHGLGTLDNIEIEQLLIERLGYE